ncbi:hypothetical protein EJB05_33344, partial [Eragrostis curvula]
MPRPGRRFSAFPLTSRQHRLGRRDPWRTPCHQLVRRPVLLPGFPYMRDGDVAGEAPPISRKCGEVSIPYPFGVGAGCYREGFKLTCNGTYDPPKLFLDNGGAEVLNISPEHGTLHIDNGITRLTGSNLYSNTWGIPLDTNIFTVSASLNKFVVIGCGFQFRVRLPDAEDMVVACASSCLHGHSAVATDGACSGVGCCETSMPGARNLYSFDLIPFDAGNCLPMPALLFNATVVVVDKAWWDSEDHGILLQKAALNSLDISRGLPGSEQPVKTKAVVNWKFSNLSCAEAQGSSDFGCLSDNSYCRDRYTNRSSGHLCHCRHGFEGNPYIPNGCQDIDECADPDNYPCLAHCMNTVGSYECICPQGTSGNPQKLHGCIRDAVKFSGLAVAIGVGSGACFVLLTFYAIILRHKLSEILDPQITKEGEEEAREVAKVAVMCLSSNGEDRPTMKQVEMRLELLESTTTNIENDQRTKEHIVNIPSVEGRNCNTDTNNTSRRFSMERDILLSMSCPR